MPFAFVFLLVIFLEIAGFVAMAEAVGLLGVFVLVIAGMVAGALVIRTIGVASVLRMQERSERGETVGQEMGGLVLGFLGGVLLIVPGFLSDLIGILFLIKPIQMLVWPRYGRQMTDRMPPMDGRWHSPGRPRRPQPDETVVIDAEPTPEDRPAAGRPNGNPWAT